MLPIKKFAKKYNVDERKVSKAFARLKENRSVLYGMSGKMGSGKDTIGDLIKSSNELKEFKIVKTSYATPLRKEISDIARQVKFHKPLEIIAEDYNVTKKELINLLKFLDGKSIFDRTKGTRKAIQYWGTNVRRKQNPNYWVNKTVDLILDMIVDGKSVYVSDARFPNEVYAIYDLGGEVIRLDVPTSVRTDRIGFRDGAKPTMEALDHKSETGLDKFKFKHVFNGCVDPEELSKEIIKYII